MSTASRAPEAVKPGVAPEPELSNGNGRKLSRLHMQKHLPDFGIVLNLFADTPEELWALYSSMLAIIDNDVASAYIKASTRPAAVAQQPKPAPKQSRDNGGTASKPVCQECGSDEAMELISWKDKGTGEIKKAWKCQSCNLWARKS